MDAFTALCDQLKNMAKELLEMQKKNADLEAENKRLQSALDSAGKTYEMLQTVKTAVSFQFCLHI